MTTVLPPFFLWLSCLSHGDASDAIFWPNVLLHIATVIQFKCVGLYIFLAPPVVQIFTWHQFSRLVSFPVKFFFVNRPKSWKLSGFLPCWRLSGRNITYVYYACHAGPVHQTHDVKPQRTATLRNTNKGEVFLFSYGCATSLQPEIWCKIRPCRA